MWSDMPGGLSSEVAFLAGLTNCIATYIHTIHCPIADFLYFKNATCCFINLALRGMLTATRGVVISIPLFAVLVVMPADKYAHRQVYGLQSSINII